MIDAVTPERPALAVEAAVRRGLDLVVAAMALMATAPLMLAVAVAIVCEAPGPLLFRQQRLGRYGRPFTMYKFRKFHVAAACGGALTLDRDPRMTAVGRFLMASKLDELPQLWNVLRGDMAMIGPRPESLAFADCFRGAFAAVLDHTPGLLGPCQVLFRNESALFVTHEDADAFYREVLFPAKAEVDLAYARRRTILSDLSLMAAGIRVVCGGGGEPALALKRLLGAPAADPGDAWGGGPFAGAASPVGVDPPPA